ncbi:MAG: hypothetical protein KDI71_17070 [Xanthomonadales bacterium]|nr:hypothetical protein [Xanthomonadales bacterium]
MKKLISAALIGFFAAGTVAMAETDDQVLLSLGSAKASSALSIDISSTGQTSAFSFVVPLPAGVKADTSACLSKLPKDFKGGCKFVDGEIRVIAFSEKLGALPAGVNQVGIVRLSGLKDASGLKAYQVELSNNQGQAISSKSMTVQ